MSTTATSSAGLDELRARVAEIARSTSGEVRDATFPLYAPLHPTELSHRVLRDVAYGPNPRHLLNIHLPAEEPDTARPVLLFVHGGGFVGGDKGGPGRPFYDNIGRFAVERGFVGVCMTYRFAPEFTYPSGAEDVGRAVEWLAANVADHGGRSDATVVMGHSAGAAHVATFVATPSIRAAAGPSLRGAVLSSGIYDPGSMPDAGSSPYYGSELPAYRGYSAIPGLAAAGVPLMVTFAEHDPPEFHRQAARLALAVADEQGRAPSLVSLPGHNHFSATWHIGTFDTWYPDRLADFMRTVTA